MVTLIIMFSVSNFEGYKFLHIVIVSIFEGYKRKIRQKLGFTCLISKQFLAPNLLIITYLSG